LKSQKDMTYFGMKGKQVKHFAEKIFFCKFQVDSGFVNIIEGFFEPDIEIILIS
jgi:hypothetical protein